METRKRRFGDRRDGYWLRNIDALHAFTPYLMPNRTDNEAFITEQIDITNLLNYLDRKNEGITGQKYTIFHFIAAAIVKVLTLRPKMNRFIQGRRLYQRTELTLAFVAKKQFSDDAHEALVFIPFGEDCTIDLVRSRILEEVSSFRGGKVDNSTASMDSLLKLPRFLLRFLIWILRCLDFRGKVPLSLVKADPNYASVFISNLGSIKLNAAYHHLNNWGTNSLFVVIGEKQKAPFYDDEGRVAMRPVLNLGLTLDERIADGYYYSGTIKLLRHLIEHPELLELPANAEVAL